MRLVPRITALALLIMVPLCASAQKENITATALGEGMDMGKNLQFQINIEGYSTEEEAKALKAAFNKSGMDALTKALEKMKPHGRVSLPTTSGYAISYVRAFTTPTGRRIRVVTNRPIVVGTGEAAHYTLSAFEVDINKDGKHTGRVVLAAKFIVAKDNTIKIENYYGHKPMRLVNISSSLAD